MLPLVFPVRARAILMASLVLVSCLALAGSLSAQSSVIAVDVFNKKIHVEQGAGTKRPVGGLAKVATALVALDWAETTKVPLNTLASVPPMALQIAGLNTIGLQAGDQMTIRDLIYASMMSSDNVAATTLGAFVGNDILARRGKAGDPVVEFVSQMNKLAAREGLTRTKFTNPHGLENSRSMPFSTAADMAKLSIYAISRASFRFYTNQRSRDITVLRNGQPQSVSLKNTNVLLGVGTIDGMKTGNTPQSGGCVIVTEERPGTSVTGPDGKSAVYRHRMVVVVLGSADPFNEAGGLMRQGWNVYDRWLKAGRPVTDARQVLPTFY